MYSSENIFYSVNCFNYCQNINHGRIPVHQRPFTACSSRDRLVKYNFQGLNPFAYVLDGIGDCEWFGGHEKKILPYSLHLLFRMTILLINNG